MSQVRIFVTLQLPNAEVVDGMIEGFSAMAAEKANEDGALQYEAFRSANDPSKLMLVEHWASREQYDKHWEDQVAREGIPEKTPGPAPVVEIYAFQAFEIIDGDVWAPIDTALRSRTIQWSS